MITESKGIFYLHTDNTSYIFRITDFGHLESVYYGEKIPDTDISALLFKRTAVIGSSILYDERDQTYCLDVIPLEYSGMGRGDFRHSPLKVKMPDGTFTSDFVYETHRIIDGYLKSNTLPTAYGSDEECQTLEITLKDQLFNITLTLYYTVYAHCNVITRRVILTNNETSDITLRKIMSMNVDIAGTDYTLLTIDGGWIKETHKHIRELSYGLYINKSNTGASSNRHNPGIILMKNGCNETHGEAYGFNLVYSGNHYEAVEVNPSGTTRVMSGINPEGFEWTLPYGEAFETPEAVLTYSSEGLNKLSSNFHDFVNNHIIRTEWQNKERPVLLNSWEACFFKFTRGKLLSLARRARKLGIELFVLDDGWFGERNDDTSGLGDYNVNKKKLPFGLKELSDRINDMGLKFGIWVEPEMVNENSELYRSHPDWAVTTPGRKPTHGRHQLVLDICREEVRDHIVKSLKTLLQSANISYIKWDMNRHISDAFSPSLKTQGEFSHRYILALYEVLKRTFNDRQDILLETCSSGGNRFDLGMLCFSPQIWASDDTDPIERLKIQEGLSYFYPQSCIGAHVSDAPHQQTLRDTPLSTRFNSAAFASLGYELDLKYLTNAQKKEIQKQTSLYKKYRYLLQYGKYFRYDDADGTIKRVSVVANDGKTAMEAFYKTLGEASPENDMLTVCGLKDGSTYNIKTSYQGVDIRRFGGLINFLLPFKLNPNGLIVRTTAANYMLPDGCESYTASGKLLRNGIKLNNSFIGTGYNKNIRLLSDFGSQLYIVNETK